MKWIAIAIPQAMECAVLQTELKTYTSLQVMFLALFYHHSSGEYTGTLSISAVPVTKGIQDPLQ